MGRIVDRIVSVDAPATTMSEQVSVEMLEARRAERNYFLLRDPAYLEANRTSIAKTQATLIGIQNLAPSEQPDSQKALDELHPRSWNPGAGSVCKKEARHLINQAEWALSVVSAAGSLGSSFQDPPCPVVIRGPALALFSVFERRMNRRVCATRQRAAHASSISPA